MYQPHYCLRIEIATTDIDGLREYHVVLGGAQRGGVSLLHGYLPENGYETAAELESIREKLGELLEAYVCTWSFLPLTLQPPPQP